jgi:tRNA(Met) C34 N-acetyltransferase TmcA
MLEINQEALVANRAASIRCLYEKYGGMLLGYILEIVKDQKQAEQYLVQVFCDISLQYDEIDWAGTNRWIQLQRFARAKLSLFTHAATERLPVTRTGLPEHGSRNQIFDQLSDEQQQVFYAIYYQGKTISTISTELNRTEGSIRKALKEAFSIMRKSGEN